MGFESARSHFMEGSGVRLHYKIAGPEEGETVVLLHGFPEFYYGWRHQVGPLADAGFRVAVPDQRGYNLSAGPRGFRHYDLDLLSQDVVDLIDELGAERVFLAGHDWGAAVAWWVAMRYTERIKRLAVLNVPHPAVMYKNILKNPVQRRRSWYIFFFQIPFLPELLLRMNGHKNAGRLLERSGLPGTFDTKDLQAYRAAWSQPGAWTGMIHWYRAVFYRAVVRWSLQGGAKKNQLFTTVEAPVMIIWGKNDVALEASMAAESLSYCRDGVLEMVSDATHWVQHDAPDQVANWLIEFFSGSKEKAQDQQIDL